MKAHGYFFSFVFPGGEDAGGKGKGGVFGKVGDEGLTGGLEGLGMGGGGISIGSSVCFGGRKGRVRCFWGFGVS